mmetsp:Transcript_9074/g.8945  ORF Transcript_9074/g.8945 Transcript_9074/m.8945 type:complete len:259 (+) Transcript_9074:157-933(+)
MLPIDSRDELKTSNMSRFMDGRFPDYMRRLCDFRQMDFEATFDQMLTLLSFEPARVYISFYYRKQTKNQWARDDPAFMVVVSAFVAVAALAYAIAFQRPSFFGYLYSVLYSVIIDWILIGIATASTCSHLANKHLRQHHSPHSVEQEVEWQYALDVHANAFFCSYLVTYVLQYFLLPLLLGRAILPCILSNTLYALATVWYAYITHLGFRALPFLSNTQVFLWYPTVFVGFLWLFSVVLLILGIRINITRIVMAFHYG